MNRRQDTGDLNWKLGQLPTKDNKPGSVRILDGWVNQADSKLVPGGTGARLRWLVASTVVIAALQRAVDSDGRALFLLKGGTLLQHRLGQATRATKDVDGLIRGGLEPFLDKLDEALALPWGPLELSRGPIEIIQTPARVIKPRRFDVILAMKGKTWARIQVEIASDEGGAGAEAESVASPPLGAFGIPAPDQMLGLAMRFQIAQKLHAASDPHDPPLSINDRARDIVDLVLLQQLTQEENSPMLSQILEAVVAVFEARAADARSLGYLERTWPPTMVAHPHWANDYIAAALPAGIDRELIDAVQQVNSWIEQIDRSS